MTPAPFLLVVTTVGHRADADRLASSLVEQGLAACAQITSIDSVYAWKGEVCREPELRVLVKVATDAYDAVERAILALHPYELPAIHAIAASHAHAPYAEWINDPSRQPRR